MSNARPSGSLSPLLTKVVVEARAARLFRVRPGGKLPDDSVSVMAPVPPAVEMVALYAWLTVPLGTVVVTIVTGGLMVSV